MPIGTESLKRATAKRTNDEARAETVVPDAVIEAAIADVDYKREKSCPTLVESIKNRGLILPIVVVKDGDRLKVVDGTKRLNAARELGLTTIKVVAIDGDAKKIKAELKKFGKTERNASDCAPCSANLREVKFDAIKRLGDEEMPIYLL